MNFHKDVVFVCKYLLLQTTISECREYYRNHEKDGGDVFERYKQKIVVIDNVDPYSITDLPDRRLPHSFIHKLK